MRNILRQQTVQILLAGLLTGAFVLIIFFSFGKERESERELPIQSQKSFEEELLDRLRGTPTNSSLEQYQKEQILETLRGPSTKTSPKLTPEEKQTILDSLRGSQ